MGDSSSLSITRHLPYIILSMHHQFTELEIVDAIFTGNETKGSERVRHLPKATQLVSDWPGGILSIPGYHRTPCLVSSHSYLTKLFKPLRHVPFPVGGKRKVLKGPAVATHQSVISICKQECFLLEANIFIPGLVQQLFIECLSMVGSILGGGLTVVGTNFILENY